MYTRIKDESYESKLFATFSGRKLFIMPGTTNGCYGIDTLSALVMMFDPDAVYEGAVFAFCIKSKMQIRFLVWDDGGYYLITRKIYHNSFVWPNSANDSYLIQASIDMIRMIFKSPGYSRKEIFQKYSFEA